MSYSYFRPALLGLLKQMAEKGPDVDAGESFRPTRPRAQLREKGDGGGIGLDERRGSPLIPGQLSLNLTLSYTYHARSRW